MIVLAAHHHQLLFDTEREFNSLRLTFIGEQQLTNGMDKEGDLMRFNI